MSERWTMTEIAERAARGLGKVDTLGPRGATLVSRDEVEAMAAMLAILGLRPIPPGAAACPQPLIDKPENPLKGPADV